MQTVLIIIAISVFVIAVDFLYEVAESWLKQRGTRRR